MATSTSKGYPYPVTTDPDKPRLDIKALADANDKRPGVEAMTQAERDLLTNLWPGRLVFVLDSGQLQVNRTGVAGDWSAVIDSSVLPLPIAAGGTGLAVAPSLIVDLGSSTAVSPLAPYPKPGVSGTLPQNRGGTGSATAAGARNNLDVPSNTEVGPTDTDFVAIFDTALA